MVSLSLHIETRLVEMVNTDHKSMQSALNHTHYEHFGPSYGALKKDIFQVTPLYSSISTSSSKLFVIVSTSAFDFVGARWFRAVCK